MSGEWRYSDASRSRDDLTTAGRPPEGETCWKCHGTETVLAGGVYLPCPQCQLEENDES